MKRILPSGRYARVLLYTAEGKVERTVPLCRLKRQALLVEHER